MKNQENTNIVEETMETKVEETPTPKFKLVKITRSICRTINTGDYQNQKIDISLEAEIYNTEDYKEVADTLKAMIETELDIQEQEILEKVQKAKEEKLQQEEQAKSEEPKVEYTQYIFNVKGQNLVVSNDPNFEMKCPKCGRPLASRNGQYGEFYGCTGYNQGCRFAVNKSEIDSFLQTQQQQVQYPTNQADMRNYLQTQNIHQPVCNPGEQPLYSPELQHMVNNNIPVPSDWKENTFGYQNQYTATTDDDLPF